MTSNAYVEAEGTVSVPSGSRTVIGTGTGFATKAVANGTLRIGGVSAAISTVDNDTRLTLLNNWPGPTVSDSVYEIDRVISDAGDTVLVHDKSAQMLALLNAIATGYGETLLSASNAAAARDALQALAASGTAVNSDKLDDQAGAYYRAAENLTGTINNARLASEINGKNLVNCQFQGGSPKFLWQSGVVRDTTDYTTSATTAFSSTGSLLTVSPVRSDTKLVCTITVNSTATHDGNGDAGIRVRPEYYEANGADNQVIANVTNQESFIEASHTGLDEIGVTQSFTFELDSTRKRVDTGNWQVRLRFSSNASGGSATIDSATMSYLEISE